MKKARKEGSSYIWKKDSWNILDDIEGLDTENERYEFNVQIGTEANGEPIIEVMYSDIYIGIQNGVYECRCQTGKTPAVFVLYTGKIVPHNDDLPSLKEEVLEILKSEIEVGALFNMVREYPTSEKKYTAKVMSDIGTVTDKRYNTDFVYHIIKEYMRELGSSNSDLEQYFSMQSMDELLAVFIGTKEKDLTDETTSKELLEIMSKGYDFDNIKFNLKEEICNRVLFSKHSRLLG